MGGGASTQSNDGIVDLHCGSTQKLSFQEDGCKGKMGAILKSDEKISALLKYLERIGKGCLLHWYFDLDEYKRTNSENLLSKALEIRKKYDPTFHIATGSMSVSKEDCIEDIWKSVNKTLPNHNLAITIESDNSSYGSISGKDNSGKVKSAFNHVNALILREIEGFMCSNEYRILESNRSSILVSTKKQSVHISSPNQSNESTLVLDKDLKEKYKMVLIINDSYAASKSVAQILEAQGHSVRIANHGRVGINIATNNIFGIILMDVTLKTMDPVEVVRAIKKWYGMDDNRVSSKLLINNSIKKIDKRSSNDLNKVEMLAYESKKKNSSSNKLHQSFSSRSVSARPSSSPSAETENFNMAVSINRLGSFMKGSIRSPNFNMSSQSLPVHNENDASYNHLTSVTNITQGNSNKLLRANSLGKNSNLSVPSTIILGVVTADIRNIGDEIMSQFILMKKTLFFDMLYYKHPDIDMNTLTSDNDSPGNQNTVNMATYMDTPEFPLRDLYSKINQYNHRGSLKQPNIS